ncbi:thiamine pyrophosphokinase [Thermoflexales bacterium]|nr:thiamine pyrophosphokinase [Thermoflexales bacterium]
MRALIFANGAASDPGLVRHWVAQADLIIAADGGTRHALSVSVMPHVVIGDLDSLDEADRAQLDRSGVQLIVHPTHKDCTDLELALRYARERGATEIVIFSALGGRWDQALGNLMLLTLPELAQVSTRVVDRHLSISVVRDRTEIVGRVGDTLSLLALQGDAQGVTLEGCEYPLNEARLPFGATLGISNVLTQSIAKITVKQGLILALHLGREE